MYDRGGNLCDVPVFKLKRDFQMVGLTRTITELCDYTQRNHLGPVVLDLLDVARVRWSEIMVLADRISIPRPTILAGILAQPAVLSRLSDLGLERLVPMATKRSTLARKLGNGALQSTPAMLLCNGSAPLLGPLACIDPQTLEDPIGRRPWVDGLFDLHDLGARDVTVVLRGEDIAFSSAFRAICPPGLALRFQLDAGTLVGNVRRAFGGPNGWGHDVLLVDGRFQGQQALIDLMYHHRQSHAGMSEVADGADSPAMVWSEAMYTKFVGSNAGWDVIRADAIRTGMLSDAQPHSTWSHCSNALTWAKAVLSQNHLKGRISQKAHLAGKNYVDETSWVDSDASLENSIILPGVHVQSGAWIRNMIVAPDWALRYDFAQKMPLNLTPADCVTSTHLSKKMGQRVA